MATLYQDWSGGNDANDGTSFANRVKTLTSGITAARTAPGDTIRWMKTADPLRVQTSGGTNVSATFTDQSPTVTLDAAATANVNVCDGTGWTGSANVTPASSTTRKEGGNSQSLAIAAGFTTGLVAYAASATTDLSAFTKLCFWIRPNAAVSANVYRVDLCSDPVGAVAVNSFTIDEALSANLWHAFTFNNGSALGASIQSIAIVALSDPGTVTLLVDNFFVANRLTLNTPISKQSAAVSFEWYPVQSINGTTVKIDYGASTDASTTVRGYYGTTETVAIYCRETVRVTSTLTTQEAGTATSRSTYSGGWDTTNMTTQDGMTWIDARNSSNGFTISNFLNLEKIGILRANISFFPSGATDVRCDYCASVGCENGPIFNSAERGSFTNGSVIACGAGFNTSGQGVSLDGTICYSNLGNGILYNKPSHNLGAVITCNNAAAGGSFSNGVIRARSITSKKNGTNGITVSTGAYMEIGALITESNASTVSIAFANTGSVVRVHDYQANEANYISTANTTYRTTLAFDKLNGSADARIYQDTGTIFQETSVRHTASGIAWKHTPGSIQDSAINCLEQECGDIYVEANKLCTFKVWARRSNSGVVCTLCVKGGYLAGVASDVTDSITAAIDTWEELSVTFTPTEAGAVKVALQTYSAGTGSGYYDDFTPEQAA